jgi:hypothetical protein
MVYVDFWRHLLPYSPTTYNFVRDVLTSHRLEEEHIQTGGCTRVDDGTMELSTHDNDSDALFGKKKLDQGSMVDHREWEDEERCIQNDRTHRVDDDDCDTSVDILNNFDSPELVDCSRQMVGWVEVMVF